MPSGCTGISRCAGLKSGFRIWWCAGPKPNPFFLPANDLGKIATLSKNNGFKLKIRYKKMMIQTIAGQFRPRRSVTEMEANCQNKMRSKPISKVQVIYWHYGTKCHLWETSGGYCTTNRYRTTISLCVRSAGALIRRYYQTENDLLLSIISKH